MTHLINARKLTEAGRNAGLNKEPNEKGGFEGSTQQWSVKILHLRNKLQPAWTTREPSLEKS